MTQQSGETLEGTGKVFNKSEKQAEGEFFTKMPSNLFNYVHVPGYKPEFSHLYAIIVDCFNTDYGYAFPSEWQISRMYGKGVKTVRTHLRKLEQYGLLRIVKTNRNKRYIPLQPLDKETLFKACPKAKENYLASIKAEDEEEKRKEATA